MVLVLKILQMFLVRCHETADKFLDCGQSLRFERSNSRAAVGQQRILLPLQAFLFSYKKLSQPSSPSDIWKVDRYKSEAESDFSTTFVEAQLSIEQSWDRAVLLSR